MRILMVALYLLMLLLPSASPAAAGAQDTLRPEISSWGVEGNAKAGESFRVWANVSDAGSGVRNVTLVIVSSYVLESRYPLPYNGSVYTDVFPPLSYNITHSLSIIAFDVANNSATSYAITVDRRVPTTTPVDPGVTWPVVLSSSLVLMAVVLFAALRYDRRRSLGQQA